MLYNLTKKEKETIKCEVNIVLHYQNCEEVITRYNSLKRILHNYKLEVVIEEGRHIGPCLDFICKGEISLADADDILSHDDYYSLPLDIVYFHDGFVLKKI